jgi:hypothetical protein
MSITGQYSPNFICPDIESLGIKSVFDLVFRVWSTMTFDLDVIPVNNGENFITYRFYDALCTEKSRQTNQGQLFIYSLSSQSSETDGRGNLLGIPDIIVTFNNDERNRFVLEAKLLNKNGVGLQGAYVEKGMMRFIRKRYAAGTMSGGMIGYVFDGNISAAKCNVTDKIVEKNKQLRIKRNTSLQNSDLHESVYVTLHERDEQIIFTIYHIFLPLIFVKSDKLVE